MVVIGCEGRRDTTAATIANISERGGANKCTVPKVFHWQGVDPPPFIKGWDIQWRYESRDGQSREAFWRIFRRTLDEYPGHDAVFMEDDIEATTNAVPYVVAWDSPHFTSFFNTRGSKPGPYVIDNSGFWGTQCFKVPAEIFARIAGEDCHAEKWLRTPRGRVYSGGHQADIVIGRMLQRWGLPVYQHRSLFQHVGATSLCAPGATLRGIRAARDYPGDDFDALTLRQ